MDLLNLISYIDSLFDIVVNIKTEESLQLLKSKVEESLKTEAKKGNYDISNDLNEYEKCIAKLEAEVRSHISVQQQLKIYIEVYQQKLEDADKEKEK